MSLMFGLRAILVIALATSLGCGSDNNSPALTDATAIDGEPMATANTDGGPIAPAEGGIDGGVLDDHSGDAPPDATDAGDGSTTDAIADREGGYPGPCIEPLASVGACPGSYGDAFDLALTCQGWPSTGIDGGYPWRPSAGRCGTLAFVAYYGGTFGSFTCYYDGVDAGALVGAETNSDYSDPVCGGIHKGGQVPDSCPLLGDALDASCLQFDAGTDSFGDGPDATAD
jgi:hypothetical protein